MHSYTFKDLILKADNISLRYGDKQILRNVSFEIYDVVRPEVTQGQVVALIGRSGVGKTQLFKILAGLTKPNSGRVLIDVDQHEVKQGEVGVIYQNYLLFNHRTIFENLRIGLNHSGKTLTTSEKKEIIDDYANKFELTEQLKKYPQQLSGGQKQRVSILQQILTGNKFILMDEPFSGLDMLMIDKVLDLIHKISNTHEQNTLIIVSHDVENAMAISDTVYILAKENGKDGATVTEKIDLMALGMAWETEIKKKSDFQKLILDIKYKI